MCRLLEKKKLKETKYLQNNREEEEDRQRKGLR